MLKENKGFIEFLNISLSNFGKDRVKQFEDKFLEIYQFHFNAQVFYLQSDYKNAYRQIRNSQLKQTTFFLELLMNIYLEDTKDILDRLAPNIIRSKNPRSRLYLTLGYRDRSVSKNFETVGDASNPKLYSYKLHKYVEAIKFARRSKRYGFLSLYESQNNEIKRAIYTHLFEMERESGNKFFTRFLSKSGQSYMDEIDRPYVEDKDDDKDAAAKDKGSDAAKDSKETRDKGKDTKPKKDDKKDIAGKTAEADTKTGKKDEVFEKRVAKRVRYRIEKSVARHLINNEFDRAEELIRSYVENLNFKMIIATLEVIGSREKDPKEGAMVKNYITHHYDNYGLIPKNSKSLLEELTGRIKVIDDIKRDGTPVKKDETKTDKDKKVSEKDAKSADKKDLKDKDKDKDKKGK